MQDRLSRKDLSTLKQNISEVIHRSSLENNRTKLLLNEVFQNLAEYTNKQITLLQKKVEEEIVMHEYPFNKLWNVYTMLVSRTTNNNYDEFKPILPKLENPALFSSKPASQGNPIGVFFRCSYDEFIKITDYSNQEKYKIEIRNGEQTNVVYFHFERSNIFVKEEIILSETAAQYGYNFPLIYSPYSRRFAYIVFSGCETHPENITKDFFKGTEIYDAIEATTCEKILVWNIWTGGSDTLQEEKITISDDTDLNNTTIKSVFQCGDDQYINFNSFSKNIFEIQRTIKNNMNPGGKATVSVIHKNNINLSYSIITIKEPSELNAESNQLFHNFYTSARLIKYRLNSYADIHYAVSGFQNNSYGIEIGDKIEICNLNSKSSRELEDDNRSILITDYHSLDRYYKYATPESEPYRTIKTGQKASCILTFYKSLSFKGNINFIEDYARYVLSYLNEKYPEFDWKGKKGWLE